MDTGNFVNVRENYLAAPQQLNRDGLIMGHVGVVAEVLTSLNQTEPTDPSHLAFFVRMTNKAVNGMLSAEILGGLPPGTYRISSLISAANYQPVLTPKPFMTAIDDVIYVRDDNLTRVEIY